MRNRALLVDFGGVLTTPILTSFDAFCRDEEIDAETFRAVVLGRGGGVIRRVELGEIPQDRFDEEMAAALGEAVGRTIEPAGLKQRMFARVEPDRRMLGAVAAAQEAGIPTALVSNSWGGGDDYPMEDLRGLFDAMLISGALGMRKPDPPIYHRAAEAVGRPPGACVFVDDLRWNVEGAEEVGMIGVLHRDADETIPTLEDLLGVPLRA